MERRQTTTDYSNPTQVRRKSIQSISRNIQYLVDSELVKISASPDFFGRQIVTLYCYKLPNPVVCDYDVLLRHILNKLEPVVESDYILILFTSCMEFQPSWSWIMKAFQVLGRNYRKNLKQLFIVHPSAWPKFIFQMFETIINPKFAQKIVWVKSIGKLGEEVPLEHIYIPEPIQTYDTTLLENGSSSGTTGGLMDSFWKLFPGSERSEYSKSPLTTSPSSSTHQDNLVFGGLIEVLCAKGVPKIVVDTTEYIKKHGLHVEGIFRLSPSSMTAQTLKVAYNNRDEHIDFEGSPILAAMLLKQWYKDLKEPLVDFLSYEKFKTIEGKPSSTSTEANNNIIIDERIQRVKAILDTFTPFARETLKLTFELLNLVGKEHEVNKMTFRNLAIVMAPNFVNSPDPMLDMQVTTIPGDLGSQEEGGGVGVFVLCCIQEFPNVFNK